MISSIVGSQTISQTLAQSKLVETLLEPRNVTSQSNTVLIFGEPLVTPTGDLATAQSSTELISGEPLVTPIGDQADEEAAAEDIQSDGSLEKFITDERIHLISIIRVWMRKNVPDFFERVIFFLHIKIPLTCFTQNLNQNIYRFSVLGSIGT